MRELIISQVPNGGYVVRRDTVFLFAGTLEDCCGYIKDYMSKNPAKPVNE